MNEKIEPIKRSGFSLSNLISQLKSDMKFFSSAERKLVNVILDEPLKFTKLTLTEASRIANVSQGSIINFSKKYSGGGFPILKLKIAECLGKGENNDTFINGGVLSQTVDGVKKSYDLTSQVNSEKSIEIVADKISKAKKIEIYGIFRSAAVAMDFYFQLIELGVPATFVNDVLTCAISASTLDENSLVIAISSSGRTKDVIDAVKNAKEKGASVACITSNKNSPLAKISDYTLIATSINSSETEVRSSQLVITDAICTYLRNNMDYSDREKYIKVKEILRSHSIND